MSNVKQFTAKITQQLITSGERAHCNFCPVARAISTATGMVADVGSATFGLGRGIRDAQDRRHDYKTGHVLPAEAVEFIQRFDIGDLARPFEFAFDVDMDTLGPPQTAQPDPEDVTAEVDPGSGLAPDVKAGWDSLTPVPVAK